MGREKMSDEKYFSQALEKIHKFDNELALKNNKKSESYQKLYNKRA